jgi:hypothetical protein
MIVDSTRQSDKATGAQIMMKHRNVSSSGSLFQSVETVKKSHLRHDNSFNENKRRSREEGM